LLSQQGKHAEAGVMHQQMLQLRETVLGKDRLDRLSSMNNLAPSPRQQNKHMEAEAIYPRVNVFVSDFVIGS
jgi:hypothetical protein